jgi:thiosulfate dehydrogenase [quinone] large subunit
MAVTGHRPQTRRLHIRPTPAASSNESPAAPYVWAIARIGLGFIFFWAFADKLFGLGHDTTSKKAWIHGGHPTMGFLKFSAAGPLKGFYHSIAGAVWADWLFMLGLAGIGTALILGIAIRLTAATGVIMMIMMWSVVLPPDSNPFLDEHLIYALLLSGLALVHAGNTLGLGHWWNRIRLTQHFPILK